MQVDFSSIEDVESFVSVPEGVHSCRVVEVREGLTRDGNPRWSFRLEVADGDHMGRTAAWDTLVWSPRGLPRVKEVLARLGFDVSGTLSIQPQELVHRRARVQVQVEQSEDPKTGKRVMRPRVPYMGYEALEDDHEGTPSDEPS